MSSIFDQTLRQRLTARRAQDRYRVRPVVQSLQGPVIRVDGRELIGFCSNDYLGLANHPRVREAFRPDVSYVQHF